MTVATHSVPVTTYYLEMLDRANLNPKRVQSGNYKIERIEEPCAEFNRFLYCAVGWQWYWIDKLPWSYEQWKDYVEQPDFETWVGYLRGTPAGYFELERESNHHVKIVYFGLLSQFTGRGLGGALLTAAIERAWDLNANRVWVHTCTLDHPAALPNYLARGFRIYDEETHQKTIPVRPRREWP
jgi:GNAT superfamily N-acetyltransferase